MPTYEYLCHGCSVIEEITHSIKDSPVYQCKKCESKEPLERLISKNFGGFVMKGGTPAINWKEKRLQMKKNAELSVKQIDRYGTGSQLQPNVAGHETESWSDAAKLAKEAGMSSDTYQPMIEKEKVVSKISGVDDTKWKAAKEAKDKA